MSLAQDIIDQAMQEVQRRSDLERTWNLIANLLFVHPDREFRRGSISASRDNLEGWAAGSKVAERAAKIYDITGVTALERLTTGMLSLITPDNEKWQGLKPDDPFGAEFTDEEEKWAERQRDYLFTVRYDPRSGWMLAHQAALRSCCALGTGAYIIEESFGKNGATASQVPYSCTNLPLSDNYLTINGEGFHDQDFRFLSMSHRAAAQLFEARGGKLSPEAEAIAKDPKRCNQLIQLLHFVGTKEGYGVAQNAQTNMPVASVYVEINTRHIIKQSGFNYWPIIVYNWNQMTASPYGESPASLVLAEVASANVLAKNALLAAQQNVRPPIAMVSDSTMNRPNLNPGAINFGGLSDQGELKIKPILTGGNPQLSQVILDASRNQIKEGLYTNLWQILIQNPKMTATEAMIRANEKGELLGPVGTRIQHGLARLTDAELSILIGKGAYNPNSPLAPPESVGGKKVSTKFSGPLDRLRRNSELLGIQQTIGMVTALGAIDPEAAIEAADNIDGDEVIKITREVAGAPARIMRSQEAVAARRDGRNQQKQLAASQQIADVAKTGAEAAAAGVPAVQGLGDILGQMGTA